ncbi:transposase [Streptomyces canus]|uniref:transposase n=1 Tax=Streptomyces canus TaxID=58343 RepID=UPI002E2881D3|nr:transposase [Streptomyces canus]
MWHVGTGCGRPPEHDPREIMNAILHLGRTGMQWHWLPYRIGGSRWKNTYADALAVRHSPTARRFSYPGRMCLGLVRDHSSASTGPTSLG